MSRISSQSADRQSRQQLLAWSLCILALGLLAWRSTAIFTHPPQTSSTHPLSTLVETIVGPGNAQISETGNGELLILLNGPVGVIDPATAARLNDIVQTISKNGVAPVLKQFPFAQSTSLIPTRAELTELSVLGLLAGLGLCFAFMAKPASEREAVADQMPPQRAPQSTMLPPDLSAFSEFLDDAPAPPPFDTGPQGVPAKLLPAQAGPRSLVDAQRFAQANPDVTANVIKNWIRARGFEK